MLPLNSWIKQYVDKHFIVISMQELTYEHEKMTLLSPIEDTA